MSRQIQYVTQRTLIPTQDELAEGAEKLLARSYIALRMYTQYGDLCDDIKAMLTRIAESRRPAPPPCPDCGGPVKYLGDSNSTVCVESCWEKRPRRGKARDV